jgi:hypothetical protein
MGWQYYIQNVFLPNVNKIICLITIHSLIFFNFIDGLDKIDISDTSNSLKNQTVGLLQAVSYLKGIMLNFSI